MPLHSSFSNMSATNLSDIVRHGQTHVIPVKNLPKKYNIFPRNQSSGNPYKSRQVRTEDFLSHENTNSNFVRNLFGQKEMGTYIYLYVSGSNLSWREQFHQVFGQYILGQ